MGHRAGSPLPDWLPALRHPQQTRDWDEARWEQVIRLSRRLRLLARLADAMDRSGELPNTPARPRSHLVSELRLSRWRCNAMQWALRRIGDVLAAAPYPHVLLKGAAYLAQDLPVAYGRMPSDIDILVPKADIADAQRRLVAVGWAEVPLDDHDQRYYHEWSHEVPPMRHALHALELDLHHNILPPLARVHVDATLLLAKLQPTAWASWKVLDPVDQVLHSAAHLFHDSDNRDRLRDLVDIDGMLRHFGTETGFWDALPARAEVLGLHESLALAAHFCSAWLETPVPDKLWRELDRIDPSALKRRWLYPLLASVLEPVDTDQSPGFGQTASACILLLRHHLGRMPLRLLLPHLAHKLWPGRPSSSDATGPPIA
jgi:hypothetical protein